MKSLITPARAFAYRPFGSRFSATSSGTSTKTSTKGSGASSGCSGEGRACSSRAVARSAWYGEMKDVMAMVHESAKSLATCCFYLLKESLSFLSFLSFFFLKKKKNMNKKKQRGLTCRPLLFLLQSKPVRRRLTL